MTLRYYYRNNDGDVVEIINPSRIRRGGTEASYQAEEGAVGTWTLEVDDPDGTFNVRGFRILYVQEDDAVADAQHGIIGVWYTGDRSVSRLSTDSPAKRTDAGRTWSIQLHDLNTRLSWRLLIGADTDRPNGETDLETVAWLMGTNEMGWLDDDDTYVDSADGVGMSDDRNYSGQSLLDVLDDCAQTSGRNYGLLWEYSGSPSDPIAIKLWYKFGTDTDYTSDKFINNAREFNDPDTYYPSLDATLARSPSRVAWGVNQLYDGGSVYRTLASTAERFNKIDVTGRGENVKTASTATIRADRYLSTVSNEETDRIEVSVIVDPADVNAILPFHRLPVWFSHLPGYDRLDGSEPDWAYMRVVERTVRDRDPFHYELGLTLMAPARDTFPADEGGGSGDETVLPWFAHVEGSSGPYPLPSGPIYWDKSLDQVGLPWWNTVGPFDYADIPDRDWPRYLGIEVTADAFLSSISMRATAIGVMLAVNDPYTVTWEILHNGVAIAEEHVIVSIPPPGASGAWSGGPVVTANNITCAVGDIIAGRISCIGANGSAMEMFRSPLGINAGQNFLNINGGYFL